MKITTNQLTGEYLQFHCENKNGFFVDILNLGGIIQRIVLQNGRDVVLGYDSPGEYLKNTCYFGAVIGPFANRISNGEFVLDDEKYILKKNDGENSLHSGSTGLHQKVFFHEIHDNSLILRTNCEHLEGGFPGNREIEIHYKVGDDDSLSLEYRAISDKNTVFNLTNHSYFNLSGETDCLNHEMRINSDYFTENDEKNIPTGEIVSVENSPLDFRFIKRIGKEIDNSTSLMKNPRGYDHNYILSKEKTMKTVAEVSCQDVEMYVTTDCPCMQFCTGNFITDHKEKNGSNYGKRSGFCLETGVYQNNMNINSFPTEIIGQKDIWQYETIFTFQCKESVK